MSKHRHRKQAPPKSLPPSAKQVRPPVDLDELWLRVRSGAANVAGIRYQLGVTAHMLAHARAAPNIEVMTPEGLEDIDCRLADGRLLLVQVKERAAGDARFGPSHLRSALTHAADATRLDPEARFAMVTDAEFTSGLIETGFERSVADTSPGIAEALVRDSELLERDWLLSALSRTHLLRLGWLEVPEQVRQRLGADYQLPPAVAEIAYAALLEEISAAAADQRGKTQPTALRFRPSDLDTIVHRVRAVVDVERLGLAERRGLLAPLDFTRPLALPLERFLLGVDVEPGHIAARLDVLRANELGQIFTGLREDRYVLVAGPSGAGKSALLWRAAYELGGRLRLLRLRRVASDDVVEVVRYVEALRPSEQLPLLICADDLGRSATAGWEEAVDRLLELLGVHLLGAVREEDFRSSLQRGRARLVRPVLDRPLADEVVAQLRAREASFALEPHEAFARAEGLLMEYLTLLVAGKRLREIVRSQVEERLAPERTIEREVLRHVAAAHVCGVSLPAAVLSSIVPAPEQMPAALQRLEDEFLVQRVGAGRWTGLHELRSRTVSTRLHELPPPTEAQTLARLLPVLDASDRRTLVVAAALAGHSLEPLAVAAGEVFTTAKMDAEPIYSLLDGFIEAEELFHARACLDFHRRENLVQDPVSVLPILQGLRDGWIRLFGGPNGKRLDSQAAALPGRMRSFAAALADRISDSLVESAILSAPLSKAVELLELLAFLGRRLPVGPVQELIARASGAQDVAVASRAVAALVQATPESVDEIDRIAGTLEARLDALAEFRRDVLRWDVGGSGNKKRVSISAAEHGDGQLNDRLFEICRLVYEGCPEVEQVTAKALASDGSDSTLLNSRKAPPRRNVVNLIRESRRIRAFEDALRRLTAADSWSERLRRQEEVVRDLTTALEEAIPRLLNPHDNASRIRSWGEGVDRLNRKVQALPAVPLPAATVVERTDRAKDVLDRLSHALRQLRDAISSGNFENIVGLGSQLQGAFDDVRGSVDGAAAAGAGPATRDWPILRRLLAQLDGLRETADLIAGLLLALHGDLSLLHRVPRAPTETWRATATRVIAMVRDAQLGIERSALEEQLGDLPHKLFCLRNDRPGSVRLVNDSWLIVCEVQLCPLAGTRLMRLTDEMRLVLGFRTYTAGTVDGLVVPMAMRRLGTLDGNPFLYPVGQAETAGMAKAAGLECLRLPAIEEAVAAIGKVVEASYRASRCRLRDKRFTREPERAAALEALETARRAVATVANRDVRAGLLEALTLVEAEVDGQQERSLAAEVQKATLPLGSGSPMPEVYSRIMTSAIVAALLERAVKQAGSA